MELVSMHTKKLEDLNVGTIIQMQGGCLEWAFGAI